MRGGSIGGKVDRELEAGSRAHYEDPAYYTQTYKGRIHDVAFYVERACELARGHARPGAVLEYGLGNGRIALPLARHGISVVGIDHSAAMLADLKERVAEEHPDVQSRIRMVHGDMRTAKLRKKFPLVFCTFNTALHLYTRDDVEKFLARVHEHLEPNGRFVIDLSIPVAEDLARPIGDLADPLLVAAAFHADNNGCPVALSRESPSARASNPARARYNGADGGERPGMSAR